ncbi:glycosyltransferase family 4 protein [candidate division KSB1 bacterium]|nr:glycosyltransferase family 4 protein [candidate division KSB1 bacterium]
MNIVYFNYLYDLYGISIGSTRKAELLMHELEEVGNDVKIYWMKNQPQNKKPLKKGRQSWVRKLMSRYLHDPKQLMQNIAYFIKEYRIIKKDQPDLIISRLEHYLFSSLLLAKFKKIPIVIEADAPVVYELREFAKQFWKIPILPELIEKLNLKNADKSVCVSNVAKHYFMQQGVPENKLLVISNGADIEKFHPQVDNSHVLDKYSLRGKTIIGFVGSFHYWHGVENILKVIGKLTEVNPDTAFLLVGEGGPMKAALEEFVKHKNLQTRVILTGYVQHEAMPEYISAMNIVLAPYPNLPFFYYSPVKIYEYMAAGKPVVTTRIGQIAELIKDQHNGFLCEPDNIRQIIDTLLTLISNPQLRDSVGQHARETIVKEHTWREKAIQFSTVCDDVLQSKKNGK